MIYEEEQDKTRKEKRPEVRMEYLYGENTWGMEGTDHMLCTCRSLKRKEKAYHNHTGKGKLCP